MADPRFSDQQFERVLGNVLIVGVLSSALVVAAGGVVTLLRHSGQIPSFRFFRGEPADLRGLPGILRFALAGNGRGLVQLGLLLLIATPVARVAFSLVGFVLRRDFLYAAFTLIVLGVLVFSLMGHHP